MTSAEAEIVYEPDWELTASCTGCPNWFFTDEPMGNCRKTDGEASIVRTEADGSTTWCVSADPRQWAPMRGGIA